MEQIESLLLLKMLKSREEMIWANDVTGLQKKYSISLSDENIKNMHMND